MKEMEIQMENSKELYEKLNEIDSNLGSSKGNKINDEMIRSIEVAAITWFHPKLNTCHRTKNMEQQPGNVAISIPISLNIEEGNRNSLSKQNLKRKRYKKP